MKILQKGWGLSKRLHINKLAYGILKRLPVFTPPTDCADWQVYLTSVHPDPGNSCIRQSAVVQKCDENIDLDIIIPVYNTEKYVKECIESVLNQQTRFRFRVMIVNDGSTDNSPAIINSYASDPRVKIVNQTNKGFSGARNSGLEHLKGRYVSFVDSDDRLPKDGSSVKCVDRFRDKQKLVFLSL